MKILNVMLLFLSLVSVCSAGNPVYELISDKPYSYGGCERRMFRIRMSTGTEKDIPAIKKTMLAIFDNKPAICETSVYVIISGKEDIPILYGVRKGSGPVEIHSNEKIFYDFHPAD